MGVLGSESVHPHCCLVSVGGCVTQLMCITTAVCLWSVHVCLGGFVAITLLHIVQCKVRMVSQCCQIA